MATFEELHVQAALSARLRDWGWDGEAAYPRDAAAAAARGTSLVAAVPPSPAWATPILAGLASRAGAWPALLLAPAAELDDWAAVVQRIARVAGIRAHAARSEARAARLLAAGALDLLIATPDIAHALVRRSALKVDGLATLIVAWPERLEDVGSLAGLMQDLPREAQRLVLTAEPSRSADFVERHARKAVAVQALEAPSEPGARPVRAAATPWSRRASAVAQVLELLDPPAATLWLADLGGADAATTDLPLSEHSLQVAVGTPGTSDLIIAYDLPTAAQLARLQDVAEVVLLVPPGTEGYVAALAPTRRPLRLPSWAEGIRDTASAHRAAIAERIAAGGLEHGALLLSPLFERHDAAQVAAALYTLWQAEAAPAAAEASAAPVETGRIWMGIGQKDGVTAADIVATLVKDVGLDRTRVGKIEIRETFSLVEVPELELERVAKAVSGLTIRRRRVVARPDRGPAAPRGRPARRA